MASKITKIAVPKWLRAQEVSPALIAQAVETLRKRARIRRAHAKDRGEVRGGGRKPWAQKGTGRARHGSIRSPLWVGGGVTFGPRSRKTRVLPVPARMKQRAFCGALALAAGQGNLEVVKLPQETFSKTRDLAKALRASKDKEKLGRLLLIVSEESSPIRQAARNLPGVTVVTGQQVTIADVVKAGRVWIDERALPLVEKRCR